jgi:RNA polymerase subunit RPABC4/transcription elongation factor Spt4
MCEKCHYILPGSIYTSDATKTSSSDKYCERCHTKLTQEGDWWLCPECDYGYRITIGDPPELTEEYIKEMAKKIAATPLYFSDTAVGKTIGSVEPQTLTITNCEKFRVQLREVDIEFELEPDKLENIDTLIINGYKYVKER